MGYFLVFWSLFSYGVLGICHKLAERKRCRPQPLSAVLMLGGFLGMNVFVPLSSPIFRGGSFLVFRGFDRKEIHLTEHRE